MLVASKSSPRKRKLVIAVGKSAFTRSRDECLSARMARVESGLNLSRNPGVINGVAYDGIGVLHAFLLTKKRMGGQKNRQTKARSESVSTVTIKPVILAAKWVGYYKPTRVRNPRNHPSKYGSGRFGG